MSEALFAQRFARLREHTARRHQADWTELEADIDRLEELVTEFLRRVPDLTPVTVHVTAH